MCIQQYWTTCARLGQVEEHHNRHNLYHPSPHHRRVVRTAYFSHLHHYPMRPRSSTLLRHTQVHQYPPHIPQLHTHPGMSYPPTIRWTCLSSRRTSRSLTMADPPPASGLCAHQYNLIPKCLRNNMSGTRRRKPYPKQRRCKTLGKILSRNLGCISHHSASIIEQSCKRR
jgi:hypothetical protein